MYARLTRQVDAELKLMPDGHAGDFAIKIGNLVSVYEATEVLDVETRRRHAKLSRTERRQVEHVPEEDSSGSLARKLIPQRIADKASNSRYDAQVGLVIYVNLWTDFEQRGIAGLLPAINIPFKTIWLLTGSKALRIFER